MAKGLSYALGQIGSNDIADGTVIASELGTDAVTAIKISGLTITAAKIGAAAVTAAKQSFIGTGSPTGYGVSAQYGNVTASDVNVVGTFGTAFAAAPKVFLTSATSGAVATMGDYVVGTSAGSFVMFGQSGLSYTYLAIGSGSIQIVPEPISLFLFFLFIFTPKCNRVNRDKEDIKW